eukprot:7220844-Pyramimonas_sp.AAC.1
MAGAPDAPRDPRAPCVPHAPAAPGAPAHMAVHIRNRVPCRKPVRNRGGVAIIPLGWPAHGRQYASTPAVP